MTTDPATVPAEQIVTAAGVTYRQFDFWCRQGYLKPANDVTGSGRKRRFTSDELAVARLMGRLVAVGVSPATAVQVARAGGALELAPGVRIEVAS